MGQLSVVESLLYYIGSFGIAALVGKFNMKNKYVKFLLIIALPLLLATIRYNVGYDYGSYITGYYNSFGTTYSKIIKSYELGDPIAFSLITKFATRFNSDRIYLMIIALLSLIPGIAYILRDWDDTDIQPMIILWFLFNTYIFSFSACKQGIAMSILLYSLTYVYDRKLIKFLLCVGCAFLFHSTALAFVLIYFFINRKGRISMPKKIGIIAGCVCVIMNFQFVLGNALGGRYEAYATEIVEGRNRSFWLYSIVALCLVVLGRILVRMDERNEMLIMMLIVGAMCQYLGFSNAFAKRIGEYFFMAQIFLLPQMPFVFTRQGRRLTQFLLVIYIVALFYVANPLAESGMGFIPYCYKLY